VSLSSRGEVGAVAISRLRIGVDVEAFGPVQPPAEAALSPAERARLAALAPARAHRAFVALFAAKEAYLKALGVGFARDPVLVEPSIDGEAIAGIVDGGRPAPLVAGGVREVRIAGAECVVACVALGPPLNR
ncbi:MAG: 4'-phosphopantetheinyl transferase superfamily protein, partial [Hyphomicrobiales bacterium]|nr:4'-phosphopantetheinyl transferase superfamily protein [Hyphomicrobiales bacterium]